MADLRQKTFNGVVWSSVQRIGVMLITFISNVVLARLLSPNDFGCIAMLMIFISLSNTFVDGGFGSALIQKKSPTQIDYSTIFYWNLVLATILYGLLFLCAPLIAQFYNIDLLAKVLRVQGTVLILNSFSIIQQNQLRKQLKFKELAVVNILAASLSLVVAIPMALSGRGVWSLVAQQLSQSAITALLLFITTLWRPLLVFSRQSFCDLFKFGGFMLLSNLFSTLSNEIQGLFVGRMFSSSTLGLYNQAYRLEGTAATAVSSIIDQVTYPVMSSLQDDREKLKAALKTFMQVPAFVCCPLMAILIVTAKPIIILLFSEKWIGCVPYFQIFCTAGMAVCLQGVANNAIAAIGKGNVFFRWTMIKRTLTIILCVFGIILAGMDGLLWCTVVGTWTIFLINAGLVSKHIGYSLLRQIFDILPYVFLSASIGTLVYYITSFVDINIYIVALIQFVLITGLYLILSHLFRLEGQSFIIKIIKERFVR